MKPVGEPILGVSTTSRVVLGHDRNTTEYVDARFILQILSFVPVLAPEPVVCRRRPQLEAKSRPGVFPARRELSLVDHGTLPRLNKLHQLGRGKQTTYTDLAVDRGSTDRE